MMKTSIRMGRGCVSPLSGASLLSLRGNPRELLRKSAAHFGTVVLLKQNQNLALHICCCSNTTCSLLFVNITDFGAGSWTAAPCQVRCRLCKAPSVLSSWHESKNRMGTPRGARLIGTFTFMFRNCIFNNLLTNN